jgi:hypothetical protein
MKTLLACAVLVLFVGPTDLLAQSIARVGDRVRVRDGAGEVFVGRVEAISPVEMVLVEPTGRRTVAFDGVRRIERSSGVGRRFWRNFAITMGVTAGIGGVISAATWEPCRETDFLGCLLYPESRGEAFGWGMVAGGVVGIPLGVIVGTAVQGERWQPVLLPSAAPVALSLVTGGGRGVGVQLSIPLGGHAP